MTERRKSTSWWKIILIAFSVTVIFALIGAGFLFYLSRDLPSLTQIEQFDPKIASQIISHDEVVLKKLMVQDRLIAQYHEIPKSLIHALISTEDRRFYQHWGIDLYGLTRAFVKYVLGGFSRVRGTSTITQQLARNLYDKIGMKRSVFRKIKEAITAVQIERSYSKEEIISMYLNTVYFGHGVYGARAAAKKYFSKNIWDLTVDESAMLVGLLPAPAHYSPIRYPDRATKKRNLVLNKMREQNFITVQEFSAKDSTTTITVSQEPPGAAPYFTEFVRKKLDHMQADLGIDLYGDGLKIFTTLDSRIQSCADSAAAKIMKINQNILFQQFIEKPDSSRLYDFIDTTVIAKDSLDSILHQIYPIPSSLRRQMEVQYAVIVLDNSNGAIRALIGGTDFVTHKFNRAIQAKRQPGSVFKPVLFTLAIQGGVQLTETFLNQPVVLLMGDGERWLPHNYNNSTGPAMNLREALRKSVNLVAIRLAQKIGVSGSRKVSNLAKKLGISTRVPNVDAIALGTADVIPLEMIALYSTFPNQGVLHKPFGIEKVVNRYDTTLPYSTASMSREVLDKETSFIMTNLLEDVAEKGTGARMRWKYNFYRPAGGKTGTTNNWTDAWFIGFTKEFTAGVWIGMDDPLISLGEGQSGTHAALPIWAEMMNYIYSDSAILADYGIAQDRDLSALTKYKDKSLANVPDGIVEMPVCNKTGALGNYNCEIVSEIFLSTSVPKQRCQEHK